jgi:tetratricopeptide (TPR) repeat protein
MLQEAVRRGSRNPQVYYNLGRRLQEQGASEAAQDAYWQAIAVTPEDTNVWAAWTRTAAQNMGMQKVHATLTAFLEAHPDNAQGRIVLATLLMRNGYARSAYEAASRAAQINPDMREAYQIMGAAAAELAQYGEAEIAWRKAVALDPQDWRGQAGLGQALGYLGRTKEAQVALEEAVRLAPEEPLAQLQLGQQLLQTAASPDEYEETRRRLRRAREKADRLPPMTRVFPPLYLGQSFAKQGHWKEAEPWLREAEQIAPRNLTVQFELARVYQHLGDRQRWEAARKQHEAIEQFQRQAKTLSEHLSAAPDDLKARLALARLYAANGAWDEAIKTYRFLLLRAPDLQPARQEYEALVRHFSGAEAGR